MSVVLDSAMTFKIKIIIRCLFRVGFEAFIPSQALLSAFCNCPNVHLLWTIIISNSEVYMRVCRRCIWLVELLSEVTLTSSVLIKSEPLFIVAFDYLENDQNLSQKC